MIDAGWPAFVESPRLGIVVDEPLVWSAAEGSVGRPFARVIQALAGTHVEVFVLSQRPPAIIELLRRSFRSATWVSAGGASPESIRVRLSGVPLIVIRDAPDGQILASAIDGPTAPRAITGSMGLLDFLWWIGRHRGVTRANS